MKYIITAITKSTTSTGIEKASVSLESMDGQILDGVTFWKSSWPNFEALATNLEVEGEYVEKQNGQYLNKNLYPPKPVSQGRGGGNVSANMERKEKGIEKTMDRKDDSIKTSATFRDATLITIELFKRDPSLEEIDFNRRWLEVRTWLVEHFDLGTSEIPF